jgi:hypothetical protein
MRGHRPLAVGRGLSANVSDASESGRSPPRRFGAPEPHESGRCRPFVSASNRPRTADRQNDLVPEKLSLAISLLAHGAVARAFNSRATSSSQPGVASPRMPHQRRQRQKLKRDHTEPNAMAARGEPSRQAQLLSGDQFQAQFANGALTLLAIYIETATPQPCEREPWHI